MTIWFTADLHFSHDNIIKYCKRPFITSEIMNKALITNYNKLVNPKDTVYFLGDIGFSNDLFQIIPQLKGLKVIILGNHDKKGVVFYKKIGFDLVLTRAQIKVGKRILNLQHVPNRSIYDLIRLTCFYIFGKTKNRSWKYRITKIKTEFDYYKRSSTNKNWTICGHIHKNWLIKNKHINVGVDMWDYKPINLDKIIELINKKEFKND